MKIFHDSIESSALVCTVASQQDGVGESVHLGQLK